MRRTAITCAAVLSLGAFVTAMAACATSPTDGTDDSEGAATTPDPSATSTSDGAKLPPPAQSDAATSSSGSSGTSSGDAAVGTDASSSGSSGSSGTSGSSGSSSGSSGSTSTACDTSTSLKTALYTAELLAESAPTVCPCAATECCFELFCVAK